MRFTSLSVIGLGYIGLPTAAIFASHRIRVIGVDVNQKAVDLINKGKIHIIEPDLEAVVSSAVTEGYLKATLTPEEADAFIIAVPTPFSGDNHEPDLSYIEAACKSIAAVLKKGNLVILESTSPVGTTEKISCWLSEARPDLKFPNSSNEDSDISLAYCPERVLPGQIMRELIENDRLIGGLTQKCSEDAKQLYKIFVKGECVVTNARTAEMAKLSENSFRDVNIAFANELSMICDKLGINVWELIKLANRHPRVNILQPGPGVGGHCIAVDPWFIVSRTPDIANLIRTARTVNDDKPTWVLRSLEDSIQELIANGQFKSESDITIACYGLTFKADIDDIRESPALQITREIIKKYRGVILLVEPNLSQVQIDGISYATVNMEDNSIKADIHLLLVNHKEFKNCKPKNGVIIDTRGIWS